jgi:hypothetical protein
MCIILHILLGGGRICIHRYRILLDQMAVNLGCEDRVVIPSCFHHQHTTREKSSCVSGTEERNWFLGLLARITPASRLHAHSSVQSKMDRSTKPRQCSHNVNSGLGPLSVL